MKRILEAPGADDATHRTAVRLLQHVPPVVEAELSKRRVRSRIAARAARKPNALPGRLALLCILLIAGVAGARGVDRAAWGQARQRVVSWLSGEAAPAQAAGSSKPLASRVAHPNDAPVAEPAAAPAAQPAVPEAATEARMPRALPAQSKAPASSPKPLTAAALASASPPSAEPGSELMVAAMRARSAGDLQGAERLLTDYRRRFPNGALAEEALALSVETAALRGSQVAPELARAYLKRFPQGRYRAWVERTLAAAPR